MSGVPIVVHRPSVSGGRRATVHRDGRDEFLGTAYSDHDVVMFIEEAGITDLVYILDEPQ
ncbi:hypothetical protein OHB16_00315 [Streptomyces sp. NBC_00334]|nr:hypothetical protein [Streptomyces sp. NBC_00334]